MADRAKLGPDPGLELGQHERLDEIVGCSRIEPLDAILELAARSQHNHRQAGTALHQLIQYLQPGAARKQEIENDERHALSQGALETAIPVKGAAHLEPTSLEAAFNEIADSGLVLDHHDLGHRRRHRHGLHSGSLR